jgi:hypothetical protein
MRREDRPGVHAELLSRDGLRFGELVTGEGLLGLFLGLFRRGRFFRNHGGGKRRELLPLDQQGELRAVEGLPLEERVGDAIEEVAVLAEQMEGLVVPLAQGPRDLFVDLLAFFSLYSRRWRKSRPRKTSWSSSARETGPIFSFMPKLQIICRARPVACLRSLAAPVEK